MDDDHFYHHNKNKCGYQYVCKECHGHHFLPKAPEGHKRCRKCLRIFPLDEIHFFRSKKSESGFWGNCKECLGVKFKDRVELGYRKCACCGEIKPNNEFTHKRNNNGVITRYSYCRKCQSDKAAAMYKSNGDHIRKMKRKSMEKLKGYYIKYRIDNADKFLQYSRKSQLNVHNKIRNILADRIRKSVVKGFKSAKTLELLGCSREFFMAYIESQFEAGMSWDNFGRYGWNFDHVRPCASFTDLRIPEQQQECFFYMNLRPMWWDDNLSKGSFYHGKKHFYGNY